MPVKTLNVEDYKAFTGNLYEAIVIMSKRARQISAREKMELDEKLKYFEGFEEEEEFQFNEEQEAISKEYEVMTHATQRAIQEMADDEIYYRKPDQQDG